MRRRLFAALLSICLLVTAIPFQGNAAEVSGELNTELEPETEEISEELENAELPQESEEPEPVEVSQESEEELPLGGYVPLEEEEETPSVLDDGGMTFFSALPASYITPDLNPVKKQIYGNCWAFSSMFLAEISMEKLQETEEQDYSELHLTYFSYHSSEDPLGGTTGDVNSYDDSTMFLDRGGNLLLAEKVLAGWTGAADESLVPNETAEAVREQGLDANLAFQDQAHLQNSYHVNILADRDEAKKLIHENGAISISYYSGGKSKYYNEEYNSYYCPEDITDDHAVAVVGWDDNFPAGNFGGISGAVPEGDGAWYVRNCWGTDEESYSGYFWLSYYDASLNKTAYSFVFEDADNYDYNYQYDGAMASTNMGYGAETVKIANVFTVKGGLFAERLKSVGFSAYNANVDYKIEIYKNPTSDSDPESGELQESATTEGTTSYQGYYTVRLEKPVILEKGDTFAVVITLLKEGENVLFVAEKSIDSWYVCTAHAQPGQSFCKSSGAWKDFGQERNANIRIKAYTDEISREDAEPVLIDTKVSFNKYIEAGQEIHILEASGNPIRDIQVDSSYFYFECDEEQNWRIYLEPKLRSSIQKEKSFSQNLIVNTDAGDYVFPMKITVKVEKPSASVERIQKLNVFYKDSKAVYQLTGTAEIESVSWKSSAEDALVRMEMEPYHNDGELIFSAIHLNSDNYKELLESGNSSRKGFLTVHFSGYTEDADKVIPVTIGVKNVKPSWSLSPFQIKIYPSNGLTGGYAKVYDKTAGKIVVLDDTYHVFNAGDSTVSTEIKNGRIELNYTGKSSKKTAKMKLQNDNWTQNISLTAQMISKKQPAISLEKTSITLNKNVTTDSYAPLELGVYVADSDYVLTELIPDENNLWIQKGIVGCEFDKTAQELKISLLKSDVKSSSKSIKFTGTVETKEGVVLSGIPVSLTVKLSSDKVSLEVSKKGSIDLLERDKPIVCTLKVSQLTDVIKEISLSGKNADLFDIEINADGKAELRAKKDARLYAEKKYPLTLAAALKSGYVVEKGITVLPKQSSVKIQMKADGTTLYQRTGQRLDIPFTVESGSRAKISKVELAESAYSDQFAVSTFSNGKLAVMLRFNNSLKTGKYKLRFHVYLEGKAENRKPITKTLKVTVK